MINEYTKFKVFVFTDYEDMTTKNVEIKVVWGGG